MHLFFQGYPLRAIAELLAVPEGTVSTWKKRDGWDDIKPIDRVDFAIESRMCQLIAKEVKTGGDFKEIDLLGRQLERIARVNRYSNGGNEADLNPKVANRNKGPKKAPVRNNFDEAQLEKLGELFHGNMFGYQKVWYQAGLQHTERNLLKSRQIGATFYFAREALIDALTTGRNQIFLSASKAQAHQFKQYILAFAQEVGVELKGDPITLGNGAILYFLGTNSRTAQSYHGNLYIDEYFWIPKFQELYKVSSGMAMQKFWRLTYYRPHQACPMMPIRSGQGRCSTRGGRRTSISSSTLTMRPCMAGGCAVMASGGRSSRLRMLCVVGATCSTWTDCGAVTPLMTITSC